ncbi:hypothetical protein Dimus_003220 [Dionaea muscipula]
MFIGLGSEFSDLVRPDLVAKAWSLTRSNAKNRCRSTMVIWLDICKWLNIYSHVTCFINFSCEMAKTTLQEQRSSVHCPQSALCGFYLLYMESYRNSLLWERVKFDPVGIF